MSDIRSNQRVDVLFITHLTGVRDMGDPKIYAPLRMKLGEHEATIPVLEIAAGNTGVREAIQQLKQDFAKRGGPPVLTPFYLKDYMRRRGLVLEEVPCLETGQQQVEDAVSRGVGLIAISTTWLPGFCNASYIRAAAARLKALAPSVPIVAGGVSVRKGLRSRQLLAEGKVAQITADDLAQQYLLIDPVLDKDFDALVVSEGGEFTLAAMAQRVREGRDFRDLPNLAFSDNGAFVFTETVPEFSDLDGETVDWKHHVSHLTGFEVPIRTAVGCPFQCGYCDFACLYKPNLRSVDSLVAEIATLTDSGPGPHRVFFTDDNIAINRNRLVNLTRALINRKANLVWRAFIRADAIDAETAALMRDSGCRECLLGIESGDAGILKNMRKHLNPDTALEAVRMLDVNGISTQCTFVVGFPGETADSIANTAALISAFPSGESAGALHRYYLFCFHVLPLSPVASPEQREEFGLTGLGEKWAHRTMNSEEAVAAVRDIFVRVKGPSHMYLEFAPPNWPLAATRRVMEMRDSIQKESLAGHNPSEGIKNLLQTVARIDAEYGGTSISRL